MMKIYVLQLKNFCKNRETKWLKQKMEKLELNCYKKKKSYQKKKSYKKKKSHQKKKSI